MVLGHPFLTPLNLSALLLCQYFFSKACIPTAPLPPRLVPAYCKWHCYPLLLVVAGSSCFAAACLRSCVTSSARMQQLAACAPHCAWCGALSATGQICVGFVLMVIGRNTSQRSNWLHAKCKHVTHCQMDICGSLMPVRTLF